MSPYHAGHYRSERNRLRAAAGSSVVSGRAGALYRAVLSHIGAGLTWGGDFPLTWSNQLRALEQQTWMKRQLPVRPQWHERATRAEIDEVEAIDRLIANLRSRRESIINRTKMRTQVWVAHHSERRRHRPKSAA